MSITTWHGDNIASEIQGEDAYGASGCLTVADVWNILDQLHSHFLSEQSKQRPHPMCDRLSRWMRELEKTDQDLPL